MTRLGIGCCLHKSTNGDRRPTTCRHDQAVQRRGAAGRRRWRSGCVTLTVLTCVSLALSISDGLADDVDRSLATIREVGPRGTGSAAARRARDHIAQQGIAVLPRLILAMDSDNIVALNWYRSAYEQIVEQEWKRKQPRFPGDWLKQFAADQKRHGRTRRLVLKLIDRLEPGFRQEWISSQYTDPEFRQEAIDTLLQQADAAFSSKDLAAARTGYQRAFRHARDSGQILQAADKLAKVEVTVDVVKQMGFVTHWFVLGPFDAPGKSGFSRTFPPETQVDLNATYAGQSGRRIGWNPAQTTDRLGQINLIQAIASTREAVGYAYAELNSPKQQKAQIRCGADDNLSVWLNGQSVFARKQWLNGTRLDRFSAPVTLRKGRNTLLVKICQGPQHKNPAVPNNWSLQLRFCDPSGSGVGLTRLLPDPATNNN